MPLYIIIFGSIAFIAAILAIALWLGNSRKPLSVELPNMEALYFTLIALVFGILTVFAFPY